MLLKKSPFSLRSVSPLLHEVIYEISASSAAVRRSAPAGCGSI